VSAYSDACEAARLECLISQAVARQREQGKSLEQSIHETLAASQQRRSARSEAARAAWSAPSGTSFSNGTAGLPGPRNGRFVSSFRNTSYRN
jgi:hypothetical protein